MINKNYVRYITLEKGFSKYTIKNYVHYLEKLDLYAKKTFNDIDKLTTKDLKEFILQLHDENYGASTKSQIISIIKSYYKYLFINNYRIDNPSEILHYPKKSKKIPSILYEDEILLLIENIDTNKLKGKRNKAIITVMYSCGLRVSELIGLKIKEINYSNEIIKVLGKGNKHREIPINSYALEVLLEYINLERDTILAGHDSEYVFVGKTGNMLSSNTIRSILNKEIENTPILNKITPHTLRHSFATHLLNSGMDIRLVQDLLGHENVSTTEVYTHLGLKTMRDKYNNLNLR